jgi:hypothetical protein
VSCRELSEADIALAARTLDLRQMTDEEVIAHVAARHGVSPAALLRKDRARGQLQGARRDLYQTLHALGRSWPHIGRLVGRDHGTCFEAAHGRRDRRPWLLTDGLVCDGQAEVLAGVVPADGAPADKQDVAHHGTNLSYVTVIVTNCA